MLTLHNCTPEYADYAPDLTWTSLPQDIVWVDILNGSAEEIAFIERVAKCHIPSLAELAEIESSSRLRFDHGALYLSTPVVGHALSGEPQSTPIGFILNPKLMITVRFAELTAFSAFAKQLTTSDNKADSINAFLGLMDAIIDRAADVLEGVGSDLDQMSQRIFGSKLNIATVQKRPARATADLRDILRHIGRCGDLASKIRDSLLGVGRIIPYITNKGCDWFSPELRTHLETQKYDIASLTDYDVHLSNKVQLLLDATMGLINIEQNNIVKVLTVVSVVGVPPTLIAGIYGMNFHNMPEYSWAFGYQYGLIVIILSAILPLLWFKVRGWL